MVWTNQGGDHFQALQALTILPRLQTKWTTCKSNRVALLAGFILKAETGKPWTCLWWCEYARSWFTPASGVVMPSLGHECRHQQLTTWSSISTCFSINMVFTLYMRSSTKRHNRSANIYDKRTHMSPPSRIKLSGPPMNCSRIAASWHLLLCRHTCVRDRRLQKAIAAISQTLFSS